MKKKIYDVVIVGGGLIGSSLAVVLSQSNFQVLLIESTDIPLNLLHVDDKYPNARVSSINYGTKKFLEKINIWPYLDKRFFVPYRFLEVGEFFLSTVKFDSELLNLPHLGYIIENWRLHKNLWDYFNTQNTLTVLCPEFITNCIYDGEIWKLSLNYEKTIIHSRLLIGSDGINSKIRNAFGITAVNWQYRQSCMLLNIKTELDHKNTVWQIFMPSGPKAFLPLYNKWALLIWYDQIEQIKKLQQLTMKDLEQKINFFFQKN